MTTAKVIAIVALGVFYLALAGLAARPRVSPEYRDHYLVRRADCWLSEADAGAGPGLPTTLVVGDLAYPAACRYLRLGWFPLDPDGAWSRPGTATLRLPWRPGADAVRLRLRTAPGDPIRLVATLGGSRSETTLAPDTVQEVDLALPPAPDRRAWEVTLQAIGTGVTTRPDPVAPTRRVGVRLERIAYSDGG